MAIPDYETLMLPVLKVAGNGQEHRVSVVVDQLAREFNLTEEERQQLLPSGKQTTFANRVQWAKTYLGQAGVLEATRRAYFRITDRGRKVLAESPARIDNEYLSQFAEFVQFRQRSRVPGKQAPLETQDIPVAPVQAQTPDELLRTTVRQIETDSAQKQSALLFLKH